MKWNQTQRIWVTVGVYLLVVLGIGIYIYLQYQQMDRLTQQKQQLTEEQQLLSKDHQGIHGESSQLSQEIEQLDQENTPQLTIDTEAFLRAYFTYDTQDEETEQERVAKHSTAAFQKTLTPNTSKDAATSIQSQTKKIKVYNTANQQDKANVFARVWQTTRIEGVKTTVQKLVHLQLIYHPQQKKWLVNQMQVEDPPLEEEGFLDV